MTTGGEHEYHGRPVRFPGPFVNNPRPADSVSSTGAARLGEHNHEVYVGELGLSDAEFDQLRETGVI